MDQQRLPEHALHWKVPGYKKGPGRPKSNWRVVIKKGLEKMGLIWEAKVISRGNARERRSRR